MSKAFELGVKYLSMRMRTEAEVRKYLEKKECPLNEIDAALESLREYKYVDDSKYCQMYFRAAAAKGRGRQRIINELYTKGIDRDTAENAIDDFLEEADEDIMDYGDLILDERQRALSIAEKMVGQHLSDGKEVDQKFTAKVGRRLAGQGYGADTVYWVLGKLRKNEDEWM